VVRPKKTDDERLSEFIGLKVDKAQKEKYDSWDNGPAFLRRMIEHRDLKDADAMEAKAASMEADGDRLRDDLYNQAAELRRDAEAIRGRDNSQVEDLYR